jgi:1-acyl-sn-glycerol-3-phosphate acyltransferase
MALEPTLKRRLNYYWRLLATGICFVSFSTTGLLLTMLVFPIVSLTSKNEREKQQRSRKIIQKGFHGFNRWMFLLGVVEFEIDEAAQKLSQCKGKVVVANHPSLIDVIALISAMPQADCIIKAELWQNVFFWGTLRAAGYIQNSGDVESLMAACKNSLAQGYSLVVFPEGTRTSADRSLILKRGASNIAIRCDVDVVPVYINVKPSTLTKNERWYNIPQKKVKFTMNVGDTIQISGFQKGGQSLAIRARRLTSCIEECFRKGLECYE